MGKVSYEVRVFDSAYEGSDKRLFTCKVNNKYPFWRGEEGAARLAKMLTDVFQSTNVGPYADMAKDLEVKVFFVVESTKESEQVVCEKHAILMDPDVGACHICSEEADQN